MFVKTFFSSLLEDAEYENIQFDTLIILNTLPKVVGGKVQLELAFALSGAANPSNKTLNINPPFCKCFMNESDSIMHWEKDLKRYSTSYIDRNSIIELAKEVLKKEYSEPMSYSDYRNYLEGLKEINYFKLLELIVDNGVINKTAMTLEEKKDVLKILFFFNGVPQSLTSYYNQEGKFLADWLKKNCL